MVLLELKDISKEYSGKKVLDTVSLKIESGEMKVVMGPSGCGKTTLLRCLVRLEEPDYGNIYFHGRNIYDKEFNILEFRKKVGCVFQNYALYRHLNVMDNITLALCKVFDMPGQLAGRKPYMSYKNLIWSRIARNILRSYRVDSSSASLWSVQWSPTRNSLFLMSRRLHLIRS